jgi:hypothetical protein
MAVLDASSGMKIARTTLIIIAIVWAVISALGTIGMQQLGSGELVVRSGSS